MFVEMQTGRRFRPEHRSCFPVGLFLQFKRELDALRFAAAERRAALPETNVTETDIVKRLKSRRNLGMVS